MAIHNSLLGPDLHRLDRTSFRLAHSFDHLIGALLQMDRHVGQSKPGGGIKPTISFSMKRQKAVAVLSRPLAAMAW
jgi:hypothetical protein